MKRMILFMWLIATSLLLYSQAFINPAYGLLTPETMKVAGVELAGGKLVVSLTLENRIPGGYFCADRNTYAVLPDGSRLKLERSEGIPACPDIYRFKRVGETIAFRLYFSRPAQLPDWFNLIEDCEDNCFSVYGITLDNSLNEEIEKAYSLAEAGQPAEAGRLFREILVSLEGRRHAIEGSLYSNIIIMCLREGNEAEAATWYRKMVEASPHELERYLFNLSSRGIKW